MRVNLRTRSSRRRANWKRNSTMALAAIQNARVAAGQQQAVLQRDNAGLRKRVSALEAELAEANFEIFQHTETIKVLNREHMWAAYQHDMARRAAEAAVQTAQAEVQKAQEDYSLAKVRSLARFLYHQAEEDCALWEKECREAREENQRLRAELEQHHGPAAGALAKE